MEFISAEEFLKQDIDTQIAFMEWWIPKVGDLFYTNEYGMEVFLDKSENGILGTKEFYTSEKVIPLLTEGQLRKFIEDKTESRIVEIIYYEGTGYDVALEYRQIYENLGTHLLQAYWKVALEIAKEKVKA
jgi:hypothetical protein